VLHFLPKHVPRKDQEERFERLLRRILDAGAKLRPNVTGETPIHRAASSGNELALRLLLESRDAANFLDSTCDSGDATAVHFAVRAGSAGCVSLLRAAGASLTQRSTLCKDGPPDGETPLELAERIYPTDEILISSCLC
jgi:ankyrin repeat protein